MANIQEDAKGQSLRSLGLDGGPQTIEIKTNNKLCGTCRGPYDDACCGKFENYQAPYIWERFNDLDESAEQTTRDSIDSQRIAR